MLDFGCLIFAVRYCDDGRWRRRIVDRDSLLLFRIVVVTVRIGIRIRMDWTVRGAVVVVVAAAAAVSMARIVVMVMMVMMMRIVIGCVILIV